MQHVLHSSPFTQLSFVISPLCLSCTLHSHTHSSLHYTTQADNTGLGVVLLDMLCLVEWVGEHELASRFNLHLKQVRKVMQYLEREQVVMREHLRIKQQRKTANGVCGGGWRGGAWGGDCWWVIKSVGVV